MSEEMERDAIEFATVALAEYSVEAQMAAHIKREFDKKYRCERARRACRAPRAAHARPRRRSPTWHCILGKNYGSHVVHATKHFIYFYLGQTAICLFKSG